MILFILLVIIAVIFFLMVCYGIGALIGIIYSITHDVNEHRRRRKLR